MKPSRRLWTPILVVALLIGVYAFGKRFLWPRPDRSHIRVVGMVEAREVNISSRLAGRIEELDPMEGDRVQKGEVVCRIEATDIENELAKAEAELARARADLAKSERDLARDRRLFAENVLSAELLDDAESKAQVDRAAIRSAQAQVGYFRDQVRDTQIRSPIDGVIVHKFLEVGEWVTPGMPILTVDDLSTVWARVDVQETDLGSLHVGMPARVTLPGKPPMVLPGRIMAIGQEGSFATERDVRRGHQDIRTFYVEVRILESGEKAKPGMTAEVSFARQDSELAQGDGERRASD